MKKDIPELIVEDIAIAIVKEINKEGEEEWNTYFLNLKNEDISAVLVSSTGYGEIGGTHRRSSTLRHFLDVVKAKSFTKIEPIIPDVFALTNEYWVSFYHNKNMYDKKYIFLPETISDSNFIKIPLINKSGVMIK